MTDNEEGLCWLVAGIFAFLGRWLWNDFPPVVFAFACAVVAGVGAWKLWGPR